jgi:hypothetical protein
MRVFFQGSFWRSLSPQGRGASFLPSSIEWGLKEMAGELEHLHGAGSLPHTDPSQELEAARAERTGCLRESGPQESGAQGHTESPKGQEGGPQGNWAEVYWVYSARTEAPGWKMDLRFQN